MRASKRKIGPNATLLACCFTIAMSGAHADVDSGFAEFLPAPLSDDWHRSAPLTTVPDTQMLAGGMSTHAEYTKDNETCIVTITGDAPMMQGVSMSFSNPAVASMEGGRMKRIGTERVLITQDGEVQAMANNYLSQYTGNCSEENKLAYVAQTDFDGLRNFLSRQTPAAKHQLASPGAALEWDRTFGGPASDWAYAMTGTHDGGLAAAGRTESKGAGREDAWVVRVDGSGRQLWDKTFGGKAVDRARAIIATRDGGLAVAGATESKGAGPFDAWVLKLDAAGELVWDRHFGGDATDWASALVETDDGGLAVAAYTQASAEEPFDFWVIKLDADGAQIWDRKFGGNATDWASAIAEMNDGSLAVVGHTESHGAGDADMWVLKLSANGELLWDRTFGGIARDYASAVFASGDGGLLVAGQTESRGAGGVDIRLVKLDTEGEPVWDRTFGGAQDDWVRAIIETRDGGHAAAGYTMSQGAGLYDVWVLKFDHNGQLVWESTFGGSGNEWARALVETPDGGLATAGDTWSKGQGKSDVWLLKITPGELKND